MCVIFAVDGQRPSPEMVKAAWGRNKDGGGLAWREAGQDGNILVHWKKGLDLPEMEEKIQSLPMPFIAHFRVASVGGVRPDLCHPFEVSLNTPNTLEGWTNGYVHFHNGDWGAWRDVMLKAALRTGHPIPTGKWSDSRAMAWLMAMFGVNFMDVIDQKGVAFSPNDMEFFTGSGWKEINKVWCSNDLFWGGVRHGGMCNEIGCQERNGLDADKRCSKHRKRFPVNPTTPVEDGDDVSDSKVSEALLRMHNTQKMVVLPARPGSGGNQQQAAPFPPQVVALLDIGKEKQALWVAERIHAKRKDLISKNLLKKLRVQVTGSALTPNLDDLFPSASRGTRSIAPLEPKLLSDGLKDPRLEPVTTVH